MDQARLGCFPNCRVLVVGDLMLDEFVWGTVSRISPEAPVPVVVVDRRSETPGGAANVAVNVAALGGRVQLAGVVGTDPAGARLVELASAAGVDSGHVIREPDRATTVKTRVLAHAQQVVRIDQEASIELSESVRTMLQEGIERVMPGVQACVISDYDKGVVSTSLLSRLITIARSQRTPVVVDPKGTDYTKYRGATVVKPNQVEAGRAVNRELRTDGDVDLACLELSERLGPDTAILVTRGPRGMTLFRPGQAIYHVPTHAREVYDVTGAGDTVAGTVALALAAGSSLENACLLASLAAAVVVGKVGTAICSFSELEAALTHSD